MLVSFTKIKKEENPTLASSSTTTRTMITTLTLGTTAIASIVASILVRLVMTPSVLAPKSIILLVVHERGE
jgi:peptidoglycan biosynthesis protein MviN/MurJ (putative lipid II flippase)